MAVRITNFHDYTVTVDGGDVRLKLARMTVPQFEAFNAMFMAVSKGRGNPASQASPSENEDQARDIVAAEIAYLQRQAEWIAAQFKAYVHVVAGDLVRVDDDGNEEVITCGRRFAELYAGEAADVLGELWLRNGVSQKKRRPSPSPPGSGTGSSTAPSQGDHGPRPATAAGTAESSNSAPAEDATGPSSGTSSGTTAPSS